MLNISAKKMAWTDLVIAGAAVQMCLLVSCLEKAEPRREPRQAVKEKLATRTIADPPIKRPSQAQRILAPFNEEAKGGKPLALSDEQNKKLAGVYTTPGELPLLQVAVEDKKFNLPLRHTNVSADIVGHVTKVEVSQTYYNPFAYPVEAVYVFPLPENSAVYDMKIVIGARVIESDIQRRKEAREIYEKAKRQGYVAALLEQERPNVFTQSVANIEPGYEISVVVNYVQTLTYDNGEYEFVFPMVVGPRFFPGEDIATRSGDGMKQDTTIVPDASRISPPILGAGLRTGHNISLDVTVSAGFDIKSWSSPTHDVELLESGHDKLDLVLASHDNIPNRDFVLRYKVARDRPQATVFLAEREKDGARAFNLIIQPPESNVDKLVGRREMIFVVDVSGSMYGRPLSMCKLAMEDALEKLRPTDTFNVFTFAGRTTQLFEAPWPANQENIRRAMEFIDGLSAGGGTMMADAVRAALSTEIEEGQNRYVFFLTDGFVGNEDEIQHLTHSFVSTLDQAGHKARVFGFGVGSSVNRHLLDGLSQAGRGLAVYATNREDPFRAVEKYFRYLDHAVLENVTIEWDGAEVEEVYPNLPTSLFVSRPLILSGRYTNIPKENNIEIIGTVGGRTVRFPVLVKKQTYSSDSLIHALWARKKIDWLEGSLALGSADAAQLEQEITDLGLSYNLVSRYTSLVAVDRSKKVEGKTHKIVQPVEVPEDVDAVMAGAEIARRQALVSSSYLRAAQAARGDGATGYGSVGPRAGLLGTTYGIRGPSGIRGKTSNDKGKSYRKSPTSQMSSEVRKTMESARNRFEKCIQKFRKAQSHLPDELTVKIEIGEKGQVISVSVLGKRLKEKELESCLLRIIKGMTFSRSAIRQTITYPLKLGSKVAGSVQRTSFFDEMFM